MYHWLQCANHKYMCPVLLLHH